jgi:hypothetical protein
MRIVVFVGIVLLSVNISFAQYNYMNVIKQKSKTDSNYIAALPFKFLVNPSFYLKTTNFSIDNIDPNANKIIYKPNTPMKISLVGAYKWLRLGFSFSIPSYLNNKGNTESFGIYLNTQTRFLNWGLDFYYIKNQGYYLANPDINVQGWTDRQKYPFRSDLRIANIGIYTHVLFSNKLSLKAILQQSEKQLKSAGGFGIQAGIYTNRMKSDSSIVPISQRQYYPELEDMNRGNFTGIAFRPGYAYTYVYHDFYAASLLHIGIGLQFQSYMLNVNKHRGFVISPSYKFQQVFGYNVDNTFVKLSFTYMSTNFNIKHSKFTNNFMTISLGGGLRFL